MAAYNNIGLLSIKMNPQMYDGVSGLVSDALLADADGEEFAFKYYPQSTSAITEIDVYFNVTGTVNTIDFKFRVESDNNDTPSGSVLGAATAAFNVSASGWTGLKSLTTNTGTLTANTPVWIIVYRSGGGSLSGSNYIAAKGQGAFDCGARGKAYIGAAWGSAQTNGRLSFIVKHNDGTYAGFPFPDTQVTDPGVTTYRIHGTARQAIRFRVGCKTTLAGVVATFAKAGTPGNLQMVLYRGDTSQTTDTVPASSIVSVIGTPIYFATLAEINPGEDINIVFRQESDGGSASNYWSLRSLAYPTAYLSAIYPSDFDYLGGTGDTPSGYTVLDGYAPLCVPVITDPATQLTSGGLSANPIRGFTS